MLSRRLNPTYETQFAEQAFDKDVPDLPNHALVTTDPHCIMEVEVSDTHIVPHCHLS